MCDVYVAWWLGLWVVLNILLEGRFAIEQVIAHLLVFEGHCYAWQYESFFLLEISKGVEKPRGWRDVAGKQEVEFSSGSFVRLE